MKIQVLIKDDGSDESIVFSGKIMGEIWNRRKNWGSDIDSGLNIHVECISKTVEMITIEGSASERHVNFLKKYGLVRVSHIGTTLIFVEKTGDKFWLEIALSNCPDIKITPDYSQILIEVEGEEEQKT